MITNIFCRKVKVYFFLSFVWFACFSTLGHADETINWAYFSYPPLFILEDGKDPAGFGIDITNLAVSSMPEYIHTFTKMPVKRISNDMESRKGCTCVYGMIKSPDREKLAYFSHPSRIVFPRMIVIRKNDINKFGGGVNVSLPELLKENKLVLLLKKGTRYGKKIDEMLNENSELENINYLFADELGLQELKMLMARRGDYFLSLDSTLYDADKLGYAEKIVLIPIENETYLTGSVACSKNQLGKRVIEKINRMIREEIASGNIYNILVRSVPEKMRNEFKRQYKALFVDSLKQ